jgi:hypothetical protein
VYFFLKGSWKGLEVAENVRLPSSHWLLAQLVFSSTCWLHFTSKEIPWYSFLFEVGLTPALLNVDRRNRSLENFYGPYRESNLEPPILWHSDNFSPCVCLLPHNNFHCSRKFSIKAVSQLLWIMQLISSLQSKWQKESLFVCSEGH